MREQKHNSLEEQLSQESGVAFPLTVLGTGGLGIIAGTMDSVSDERLWPYFLGAEVIGYVGGVLGGYFFARDNEGKRRAFIRNTFTGGAAALGYVAGYFLS